MEKNQKILLLIIGVLIIVSIVIGFLAFQNQKNKLEIKENKFKEEYEALNGVVNDYGYTYPTVEVELDNPIVYATEEEVLDILKDGTGVIYFGFPTCPWCRNMIKPLLSAADSKNLDKIYYLNIMDIRDSLSVNDSGELVIDKEGTKNYKKILKELDSILDKYYVKDTMGKEFDTNEKRLYAPTVVAVKKGKVIAYHVGTVSSQTDPYIELTKNQQEELYSIFDTLISKVSKNTCDKNGC